MNVMELPVVFHTDINFVNKSLINYTFKTSTNVHSLEDCLMFCLNEAKCQSFNVNVNSNINEVLCEINNSTATEHPISLIDRNGFIYHERI